jgi:opacity protein-like surface antigen
MKSIIALFIILYCIQLQAQNWHVSGKFGLGSYKGDLKPKGVLKQSNMAWGVGARYDINEHIVGRAFFNATKLMANDAKSNNTTQQQRNLNFTAKLREVEIGAQYQIFSLNEKWWTPYVFVGGSMFSANPYTSFGSIGKTFLQPLGTEGQGIPGYNKKYKTTNIAFMYGIGGEYALGEDVKVGIEASFRQTGTDYIDDVSNAYADYTALLFGNGPVASTLAYRGSGTYPAAGTIRGNSANKDKFFFLQIVLTVRPFVNQWKRTSGLAGMKKDKRVGCPQTKGIF